MHQRRFAAAHPLPLRYAAAGAAVLGALGGLVGLILGLRAYAPTAWAATVEVGLPAAAVGAALGLFVGLVVQRRHAGRG